MAGFSRHWIYVGIQGHAVALDRATGTEIWRVKLKSGALVNLVRDDSYLYAAVQGQLFCLDPGTGTIIWRNPLKGLGLGLASIVAPGGEPESSLLLQSVKRSERAGKPPG
jgi:outer membrane protein assembly factor BamB